MKLRHQKILFLSPQASQQCLRGSHLLTKTLVTLFYMTSLCFATPNFAFAKDTTESSSNAEHYSNQISVSSKEAYDLLLAAEMALDRGMLDFALANYAKAARVLKTSDLARITTELSIELKQPEYAKEFGIMWANISPDDLQAQLVAATLLVASDNPEAAKYLKTSINLAREEIVIHISEIQNRLSSHHQQNLLQYLTLVVEEDRKNSYALLALSQIEALSGQVEKANEYLDQALILKPNETLAIELKAKIIRFLNNSDEPALSYLHKKLTDNPTDYHLRYFYSQALLDARRYPEAEGELQKLFRDSPHKAEAVMSLAELELKRDHKDKAIRYFKEATSYPAMNDSASFMLGQIYEQDGAFEDALEWFDKVKSGSYLYEARLRSSGLYMLQQRYDDALDSLQHIEAQTFHQQKQVLLAEIDILISADRLQEALKTANDTISAVPGDIDFLYARGLVHAELGSLIDVEKDLTAVIQRNPQHADALNTLGHMLTKHSSRYDEARLYISKALEMYPNAPAFMDSMGWLEYKVGNTETAIQWLEAAHKLSNDRNIAIHLTEALLALGERGKAQGILNKALKNHPHSPEINLLIKKVENF